MRERWQQLCARIGRGDPHGSLWFALESLYRNPPRAYHDLSHVGACLALLDEFRSLAVDPDSVEFALFMHDSVYVPGSPDNELRSAHIAEAFLSWLRASPPRIETTAHLIRVTDHRSATRGPDEDLIVDLDMAILGSPEPAYDAYAGAIRREFAQVPEPEFIAGRTRFLESVRTRPAIFRTARVRDQLDARARVNIARELARLARDAD